MNDPQKRTAWWISAALVVITFAVFWPVTGFQFTTYDDPDFVTSNPIVQAGLTAKGFRWVWHSEVARNWHPLTMLTHMLDCQVAGLKPGWPHFVNLFWHAANALLLFHLLKRMTGTLWRSALVAALFAWHPLHVESVAWVAERKDVLSTFFWLLTTWAYVSYVRGRKASYAMALVCFVLGLLSKPMLVTLPFTLLLLDYWPLGRMTGPKSQRVSFSRLVLEKIPFLVLSAALCVKTYAVQQHGGSVLGINHLSMSSRLANALVSYIRYIQKMFWPENLAALYLRNGDWPLWRVALTASLLLAISALVVWQIRRRPWLPIGWFWYLGTLVPVIGLVQVGMQTMADRYTYVPFIGLFIILAWGGRELAGTGLPPRCAAALALAACLLLTSRQIMFWKDSETLFKRMIDATPNNYMARYNLGNLCAREKRTADAISNYNVALRENPNYADVHNNLAGILLDQKRYDEAIPHYRAAVRTNPEYLYYFNLANALADAASARHDTNEFAEAVQTYRQAIQLNPASSQARYNLGLTWQAQGRDADAIAEFEQAVRLNPDLEAAHFDLAGALSRAGNWDAALAHYQAVTRLNPDRADAWNSVGYCCAMLNKMDQAADAFRQIIRLRPNDSGAYGNLGNALAAQNKTGDAISVYLTALKLNPADYQAEFNLALTYTRLGRRADAQAHFLQALRINPNYAEAKRALAELQKGAAQ
ncbi:MAG: tetratricopeptide repeat protein [Verrucomicrobiota bacterium]|jgi:tetratricopeptide (TPR) repeat protein